MQQQGAPAQQQMQQPAAGGPPPAYGATQQPYYDAAAAQPGYGVPSSHQGYSAPAASFPSYTAPGEVAGPAIGTKRALEQEGDAGTGTEPQAKRQEAGGVPETVLRLLVPTRRIAAITGKNASVVKEIKDMTGCRMNIVNLVAGCEERVVIISSPDDSEVERNSAELGLFEVHRRVIDGEEAQPAVSAQPCGILTRMLVCHSQAGSIIGKSGAQIKDIRDVSGSHIKILPPDELPPCALSNDRVVQMVGQPEALARALGEVTRLVRANPPKEKPGGPPPSLAAITGMAAGPQAGGLALASRHHGGHAGNQSFGTGSSTVVIKVMDANVGSLIGSGGSNISRLRQTSGARMKVHDANPSEPNWRVVEVTGTAEQIALAESLLEQYRMTSDQMY